MAKKNHTAGNGNMQIPSEGSILERFQNYVEKHRKKKDILNFLSAVNAECVLYSENMPEAKAEEIIEFALYFEENFYALMYHEVIKEFGQPPYVLQLAENLLEEEYKTIRTRYINGVPENIRKEAGTLADTLFEIREHRIISYVFESEEDGFVTEGFELPRTLYKSELPEARMELLFICTKVIRNKGALTVRLIKRKRDEVFGIRVLPIGLWSPVSSGEMKKASLTTPDGIELEPEEDVIYTEIQRKKF